MRAPENIGRLLNRLAGHGQGFARELIPADFSDEEGAIQIVEETEQSHLDVFTRMSGLRSEHLSADAAIFELTGHRILYASKAALLRLKENSPRDKDKLDAIALRRLAAGESIA